MTEEEKSYYVNGEGNEHPDRRRHWDKCGHHESLESKVENTNAHVDLLAKEMRAGFNAIEKEMTAVKITNTAHDERFVTLFNNISQMKNMQEKIFIMVAGVLISAIGTLMTLIVTGKIGC